MTKKTYVAHIPVTFVMKTVLSVEADSLEDLKEKATPENLYARSDFFDDMKYVKDSAIVAEFDVEDAFSEALEEQ